MAGYGPPPQGYRNPAPGAPYEFNDGENLTISDVARYARLWGIISLVSGILTLFAAVGVTVMGGAIAAMAAQSSSKALSSSAIIAAVGVALIPAAIVSIVGGIFYMRSGAALRSVVETQGNDIELLTQSIRALTLAFKIEAITMAIGFVITLVVSIAGQVAQLGGHS